ncbi:linker for activation of T-cells family member 1 isoform X2 [Monodelphis domestica]|uniref:linker for activation of T-cells family member 1 isoform X2 n=1 Tax=Monodelphis domestica TaxID=13616 RepID=UPI00044335FC|nr:linker for activation of T-cells family member 1 isoform X2 [Monodelphis domestica]
MGETWGAPLPLGGTSMGVGGGCSHARSHDNFLSPPGAHHSFLLRAGSAEYRRGGDRGNGTVGTRDQMETTSVGTGLLWLLILLFPALLVTALCLCCRDLPGPNSEVPSNDSSHQTSSGLVIIKPRYTNTSWPSTWPPGQSDLPIPSPQHPGLSHRIPSSRRDPDNRSEPSYENEEPEDADEEEEDYPNEGYLEVLPDGSPNSSSAPLSNSAPSLGNPGLRDSPSSMVSGEDYVNVPDSTEVSLGGSCEYVNVPEAQEERTPSSRTPVTDQDGEEEGPDYENVQEQSGYSFT